LQNNLKSLTPGEQIDKNPSWPLNSFKRRPSPVGTIRAQSTWCRHRKWWSSC
jgi:hypothetical protein